MMTLDLENMTREEKLQIMELIWNDLSQNENQLESPNWHAQKLEETEERYRIGQEGITDWKTAKNNLRDQFE